MNNFLIIPAQLRLRSTISLAVAGALYCIGIAAAHADSLNIKENNKAVAIPDVEVTGRAMLTSPYTTESTQSATGLDLSLRETPQSITVITQKRIQDQNLDSMGKVLDQATGVSRTQYGSAGAGYISYQSRGYNIHNRTVDGVFLSTLPFSRMRMMGMSNTSTAAYDKVAVVRGATGLLTGVGDPSGSISLERKRPMKETHINASISAGNWKRYSADLDVSGVLNKNRTLRARSVINYSRGNTWQQRAFEDGALFYGVVEYDLTPSTLISAGIEYEKTTGNNSSMHSFDVEDSEGKPTSFGPHDNASANWAYFNNKRLNLFTSLQHQFSNDWQAKVDYSYNKTRWDQAYGVATGTPDAVTHASTATTGYWIMTPRQHAVNLALKGHYTLFSRQHELMFGASYFDAKQSDPGYKRLGDRPVANIYEYKGNLEKPIFPSSGDIIQKGRQIGAYAVTRIHPTDKLSVIVGTRIGSWKTSTTNSRGTTGINESGIITPYAGIVYDIFEPISLYASYTNIFNPQSAQDRYGKILKPEKGSVMELGVKGEFFDKRLNTSMAVFASRKDNLAVSDEPYKIPGTDDDASRAEDNTKGRGFEIEVQGAITPDWLLQAGYTHNSIKDSDGEALNTGIPKQQFKLFTSYKLPVFNRALIIGGGLRWQSKIYSEGSWIVNPVSYLQKSYTVVDLMARYQIRKDLNLSMNIGNVFNKTYRTAASSHSYGAPRNLSATLRYHF